MPLIERFISLQWGRYQLIAEMGRYCATQGDLAHASMGPLSADRGNSSIPTINIGFGRLQWGRYQLIAEMMPPKLGAAVWSRASMGPLSADRGNETVPCRKRRLDSRLQWGRYQLIAEMTELILDTPLSGVSFNGAAIS